MRKLVKLIEWVADDGEVRCYDIYLGDFIKVLGSSANAYWHDRDTYELGPYDLLVNEARLMVLSDGGYVGHWDTMQEVEDFITMWMRGKITARLTQDEDEIVFTTT